MSADHEPPWHERQFVALVIGGPPLFLLGWHGGLWMLGAGVLLPVTGVAAVLWNGASCAVVPMLLAVLLPKKWLFPALAFVLGVVLAAAQLRAAVAGMGMFMEGMINWVNGAVVAPQGRSLPSNDDLVWMVAIALWLSGLAAVLRRGFQTGGWMRRWQVWMES